MLPICSTISLISSSATFLPVSASEPALLPLPVQYYEESRKVLEGEQQLEGAAGGPAATAGQQQPKTPGAGAASGVQLAETALGGGGGSGWERPGGEHASKAQRTG